MTRHPADPFRADDITRQIHSMEGHAVEWAQATLALKVEIGKRLIRAKEVLPHGEFLAWAAAQFGWNRKQVWQHVKLAQNVPDVEHFPPSASLRIALAVVAEIKRETSKRTHRGTKKTR